MRARWLYVALALIGAMSFGTSLWIGRWWSIGEVAIGPLGSRHCFNDECRGAGLSWTGGSDLWMRSAVATGVAGRIAILVLVVLAGAIAARRIPALVAKTTLVTLVSAIACAAYFIAKLPDIPGMALGDGAFLFGAGALTGSVAAIAVLHRHRRA